MDFVDAALPRGRTTLFFKKLEPEYLFARYELATRQNPEETPDIAALRDLLEADFPGRSFKTDDPAKVKAFAALLDRLRKDNEIRIFRAHGNARPVVIPVAGTELERRQIAIGIETLFGSAIEVVKGYALPEHAHGPRTGIDPSRSLKAVERFRTQV